MKKALVSFVLFAIGVLPLFGTMQSGDITAAIRGAGLVMGVTPNGVSYYDGTSVGTLFDGVLDDQRVLVKDDAVYQSEGFVLTCTVPNEFAAGGSVVVNSITWEIGSNGGGQWAGLLARMPSRWTVEGYDEGTTAWEMISDVTDYAFDYYANTYKSSSDNTIVKRIGSFAFANTKSYRRYRLTVKRTYPDESGYGSYSVGLSEIKLGGFYGSGAIPEPEVLDPERYEQDITKLVRETGNVRTITSNFAQRQNSMGFDRLFNGSYASDDMLMANYFSGDGPVATAYATDGACRIEYEISSLFRPGEEIVVSSYQIMANASSTHAKIRLPRSWRLEAYDETAGDWQMLDEQSDAGVMTATVDGESVCLLNVASVPVVKNARRFRLSITSQQWSRDPDAYPANSSNVRALLIGEIRFFGYVGPRASAIAPRNGRVDITENIRRIGDSCRTVSCNAEAYNSAYSAAKIFDGSSLAGLDRGNDRYLAKNWGVVNAAFAAGGLSVGYEISANYCTNSDVVVNGYEIMTGYGKTYALRRMPASWKFQGYDAGTDQWQTLDEYVNFHQWETNRAYKGVLDGVWSDDEQQIGHSFTFHNNRSYRKYRLLVTRLYVQDLAGVTLTDASTQGSMQLSEVRLFGYVGENIAGGTLGTTDSESRPFAFSTSSRDMESRQYYDYALSRSEIDAEVVSGTVTNLFDGNEANRVIWTITDHRPLDIECDLSDTFAGHEMVLTNYRFSIRSNFANLAVRLPKRWELRARAGGRWVKVDSHTIDPLSDQTEWTNDGSALSLSVPLPENTLSSHHYLIRIFDVGGVLDDGYHLQLGEISLSGIWGVGVSEPYEPRDFMLIFR